VPLAGAAPEPPADGPPAGGLLARELDARRALELGLPSIAAALYQELLKDKRIAADAGAGARTRLALATALLEEDRTEEAGRVLAWEGFPEEPPPELLLRRALVEARARKLDSARAAAEAIAPQSLPETDRPWLFFLRGLLAEAARDFNQAGALYQQAEEAAATPAQRSWFVLARARARLFMGGADERLVASLRQTLDRNPGRAPGHVAASQLAIALHALGRRDAAVELLQGQLGLLPREEGRTGDEWRLLLGLIAGPESGEGRAALRALLSGPADPDKQRVALRLLAGSADTPARRDELAKFLGRLIDAPARHPLTGELLLFRAQLALADKRFVDAENDAGRVLASFPGSSARVPALGLLTASAWEQGRFRNAASQAAAALAEMPDGPARAQLGVLVAEAWFRARDYRNAADAYGAALGAVPAGVPAGALMFQRVQAEILAGGRMVAAEQLLDAQARDDRFDEANRWRAEWNLARALQAAGEGARAYARVDRLLDEAPPAAADGEDGLIAEFAGDSPADLRARLAWLRARLAFETGGHARALALASALRGALDGVPEPLRAEIASTAMLLEAQAGFALDDPRRTEAAQALLKKLRADFPRSDAAVYSHIIEADIAAARGDIVGAQNALRTLADNFKDSPYAPYALYQAALYAERRGQEQYYNEAYNILENLVEAFPKSELVYYARLRQGNLLRLMNQYGAARTLYENLVNTHRYPGFADGLTAELALADCYAALAAADASWAESAAAIYERLLDQRSAPADLRVEAGYKFGRNLVNRAEYQRVETLWWRMISDLLLDEAGADALGANGRYWMSRTLIRLGELLEQQSRFGQAREVYELILGKELPGASLARERITRAAPPRP
jgi:TolA-binding protein